MDRFDLWLADVEKRMAVGKALPDEAAQLVNLKRTVLIYDLLMDSLIEQYGVLPPDDVSVSDQERIDRLAAQLVPYVKNPPDEIKDTLDHALKTGALIWSKKDGATRLHWVNYL
jgi:hypothetical protein